MGTVMELWRGKSLVRALASSECETVTLSGSGIDLGAGKRPSSHFRFFKYGPDYKLTRADKYPASDDIVQIDLESTLPFESESFDFALMMWVLDYVRDQQNALAEACRILRPGGFLIATTPLVTNIDASLESWSRPLEGELLAMLRTAGFSDCDVRPLVRGPLSSGASIAFPMLPRVIRTPLTLACLGGDALIRRVANGVVGQAPMGYWLKAVK